MSERRDRAYDDLQCASGFYARFATPTCVLGIRTDGEALIGVVFLPLSSGELEPSNRLAKQVCLQLGRYISDPDFRFDLPVKLGGTQHQRAVWTQLRAIGSGQTLTYGEIAARVGSSPRAVGQACGANPVPVVVPCHRVVARWGVGGFAHHSDGFLLTVKRWLLQHERVQC